MLYLVLGLLDSEPPRIIGICWCFSSGTLFDHCVYHSFHFDLYSVDILVMVLILCVMHVYASQV